MTHGWRSSLRVGPRDLLYEASAALLTHRLRAGLSALGIVVGVATVMTALAIGEGARNAALAEIGALGIDNVFVRAAVPAARSDRARQPTAPLLSLDDVRALGEALGNGTPISAARVGTVEAAAGARHAEATLAGVTVSWRQIAEPQLARGRWFTPDDEASHRRVAIVGGRLARDLFAGLTPIGARLSAAGAWYTIVGVLSERSTGASRPALLTLDADHTVLVPFGAMDVSLGQGDQPDRVQEIGVRAAAAADVEPTARRVEAVLTRRHPGTPMFEIVVPRELLQARLRAERTFSAVLIGIGVLALLISGVGIMNIMLASVTARVGEIGVRRAFGARRSEIVAQFGIEAVALCIAGGVAGVPLGALFSLVIALVAGWPIAVSPAGMGVALLLAAAVGLVFGVYPARVAASVQPIDALRAP